MGTNLKTTIAGLAMTAMAILAGTTALAALTNNGHPNPPPGNGAPGTPPNTGGTGMPGSPGANPQIDGALNACAASVPKDPMGGPDRRAMEACMRAKGFAPPPGQNGPQEQGGMQDRGGRQGPGGGMQGQGPGGPQQGGMQQPPVGANAPDHRRGN